MRRCAELCGNPSAAVLSGGGNDIALSTSVTTVETAAANLASWLQDRGIPTVWVTIYPFPSVSPAYPLFNLQRRAYNDWLRSGGPEWGTVVDLDPVLGGDSLDPQFRVCTPSAPADIHANNAGYAVGATAITQTLAHLLVGSG